MKLIHEIVGPHGFLMWACTAFATSFLLSYLLSDHTKLTVSHMVCNRFTYASNIFRVGMVSTAVLLLISRHTHLLQNDGVDLDPQHCLSREVKMYGVPIGLLLISSFRCQHFHIFGVLAAVGSFAYGERAILSASLSISVQEKTQRQDSLIRLSWFLLIFTVSFACMQHTTDQSCKIDPYKKQTIPEELICACYHWVSRFEILLGMQVLTSYMLLTLKSPTFLGSSFYIAAQCHIPFAVAVAAIATVMRKESEISKASNIMVVVVICIYGWAPAVTTQPLWEYVKNWVCSRAGTFTKRLELQDEKAPIFRESVRERPPPAFRPREENDPPPAV
jgi:hypothetical protein